MKKILLLLLLAPFFANAQKLLGGKNIIKTNITGDLIGNYNLTYERSVAKKLSLSVGFRYMPKTVLPSAIRNIADKYINDPDVHLEDFQMGNFAITPELRLYLSAGKMKGFYIAPYGRYASFDVQVPVSYTNSSLPPGTKAQAKFNGKFTSMSAGLLLGTQFQIAKKLVLDIWIIGAHYGSSSGTIDAVDISPAMNNQSDRDALQAQLDDVKNLGPFTFEGKVTSATTAQITTTGAWAGVRALGLSLGFRF